MVFKAVSRDAAARQFESTRRLRRAARRRHTHSLTNNGAANLQASWRPGAPASGNRHPPAYDTSSGPPGARPPAATRQPPTPLAARPDLR